MITTNGIRHTDEQYPVVEHTETGPYCGNCNRDWHRKYGVAKLRHASAAAVKFCYEITAELVADSDAEHAAEMAALRYYENRGYWDAQAHDAWEASRGIYA